MKTVALEKMFNKLNIEKVNCKHHVRGYFCLDGVRQFPVYFSFGKKPLSKFLQRKIAKSMGLELAEFVKLCKCHISKDEYIALIKDRGVIE